jgi:manganese/zinc/iron transport system substrate-binding protein
MVRVLSTPATLHMSQSSRLHGRSYRTTRPEHPGHKHSRCLSLVLVLAVLVWAVGAVGCGQQPANEPDPAGRPLNVVTTTSIITDLVKTLGGERVSVTGLMGPGVDPHLYKASAGDVSRLERAHLIFYNGLHLEAAMGEVLERMRGRVKTVAVTDGIDRSLLLAPPEFQGAYDPHVWFDVTLWMKCAERVRDALIEADPAGADVYRSTTERYLQELGALHDYVKSRAGTLPAERRVLITAHDAFNYFGRAYGFEVRGLQGISTATEAGAADVQSLAQFIAERRIPAIFVETSVSPRSIEALQAAVRARGFDVQIGGKLYSDALGDPGTPEGTYAGMIRYNIDTIVQALSR